jgi:hypothetical protein
MTNAAGLAGGLHFHRCAGQGPRSLFSGSAFSPLAGRREKRCLPGPVPVGLLWLFAPPHRAYLFAR